MSHFLTHNLNDVWRNMTGFEEIFQQLKLSFDVFISMPRLEGKGEREWQHGGNKVYGWTSWMSYMHGQKISMPPEHFNIRQLKPIISDLTELLITQNNLKMFRKDKNKIQTKLQQRECEIVTELTHYRFINWLFSQLNCWLFGLYNVRRQWEMSQISKE